MGNYDEFNIAAFLPGVSKSFCPECGAAIMQCETGRPRIFCRDACRLAWHRKHPKPEHWASAQMVVCPVCQRTFLSARETDRPRKFCSRACANRGRRMNVRTQEGNEE